MRGPCCSEAVGKTGLEAGSVTRAVWEQQPRWAGLKGGPAKSQLLLLQSTTPALHWPAPCPHIPSHPTHHPGTLLQAGTSCQPSAAHGPPLSSTELARSMASPYEPSVSTWVTQMSTPCTTWCGYVGPSRPVVPQLYHSSSFLLLLLNWSQRCPVQLSSLEGFGISRLLLMFANVPWILKRQLHFLQDMQANVDQLNYVH